MGYKLHALAFFVLALVLLALTACGTQAETPTTAPNVAMLLGTPVETINQATQAAVMTQEKDNADSQAAATAEILRANAQAALDSANATLSAAKIQDQNNANILAAQITATAKIEQANAQATLSSAGATQSAALTQDAIRQTQTADQATSSAEAVASQQNKNDLAAGTQTAVANNIATQTQVAAVISQSNADQAHQQQQGPITFLWMCGLPIFIVLLAGLVVWGFWRWLRIQQANQRILANPVDKLQAPATEVRRHRHDDEIPYIEGSFVDRRSKLTKPDDPVSKWLDEVKRKLRSDEKDEDDNPDN